MSKHVHIRYQFVKDEAPNGTVQVAHYRSEKMLADLIAKGLNTDRIEFLCGALNCSINTPSDRGVCSVRVGDPAEREKIKEDMKQCVRKDTGR